MTRATCPKTLTQQSKMAIYHTLLRSQGTQLSILATTAVEE